jgi:hypothetical protein
MELALFLDVLSLLSCPPLRRYTLLRLSLAVDIHVVADNIDKKAITMGMVFSSGNSGGIVASQVYRAEHAPRYYPGHGTAVGFCLANFVTAALLWWFLARENKRRDIAYGKPSEVEEQNVDIDSREYIEKWGLEGKSRTEIIELGENHPGYRYVL